MGVAMDKQIEEKKLEQDRARQVRAKASERNFAIDMGQTPTDILGAPQKLQYENLRDPSGQLKSQFSMTVDPMQRQLENQSLGQQAQQQAQQGLASSWGRLASRGGLDAGARERLAGQSARGLQAGMQDIGLKTSMADTARQDAAQRANLGTALGDVQTKAQFEQGQFAEQMKAMGAEQQGRAEAKKGK